MPGRGCVFEARLGWRAGNDRNWHVLIRRRGGGEISHAAWCRRGAARVIPERPAGQGYGARRPLTRHSPPRGAGFFGGGGTAAGGWSGRGGQGFAGFEAGEEDGEAADQESQQGQDGGIECGRRPGLGGGVAGLRLDLRAECGEVRGDAALGDRGEGCGHARTISRNCGGCNRKDTLDCMAAGAGLSPVAGIFGGSAMDGLGAAVRGEFMLEDGFATVNHGAYGATPRSVMAAQDEWRARMERQPSRFFNGTILPALRGAAAALGEVVGARGEDIGFVGNATEGVNAVLRSLVFAPGDEIVVLSHVYGAVRNTVRHVCAVSGARMVEVAVAFPRPDDADVLAGLAAAISGRTRLAVLDHITSSTALLLPIGEMIALCHGRGVKVLVDGAHAPGQVALDLSALGADWYVGNCHKWLFAPKGCGFLWARGDRQDGIHPAVISHGYGQGFTAEFDWTGTRDPSAWLAVQAALGVHARLGGAGLMARCGAGGFGRGGAGGAVGDGDRGGEPGGGCDGDGSAAGRGGERCGGVAGAVAGGGDGCADHGAWRATLAAAFGTGLQRGSGF